MNRHERKERAEILSLLKQVLATQQQLLQLWLGATGPVDSTAVSGRTFEEEYLLKNLKEAAEFEDAEAKAILADPTRLEAYLAQFRDS